MVFSSAFSNGQLQQLHEWTVGASCPSGLTLIDLFYYRTSCPRLNSASELVKMAPTPLSCASIFTTSWAAAGTCQATTVPVCSKTARETAARYVHVCDQPDNCLFTGICGAAHGYLRNFYFPSGTTSNSSPASGSSDLAVYTGQYHWWKSFSQLQSHSVRVAFECVYPPDVPWSCG